MVGKRASRLASHRPLVGALASACLLHCATPADDPASLGDAEIIRGPAPDAGEATSTRVATVVTAPDSPCAVEGYAGWRCMEIAVPSAAHGASLHLAIRWNLPDRAPTASSLWLLGNDGKGHFRTESNAQRIQDDLATKDGIRSIEVEFVDGGGYWTAPARGYQATAGVYASAVTDLHARGIAAGGWLAHLGYSNGSAIGATALAHHGLGALVRRWVFVSGPFLTDIAEECTDASRPTFIGEATTRTLIDRWNGWDVAGAHYCTERQSTAAYDGRSVLGAGAATVHDDASIDILVGDRDEFGPWLLRSNRRYASSVTAGERSRQLFADQGHLLLGGPGAPAPSAAVLDAVYEHLRLPPKTAARPRPVLTLSATVDGAPATHFGREQTIYGRVENVGATARACLEVSGTVGACDRLSDWQSMPDGTWWTYSAAEKVWRSTFTASKLGLGPGTYRSLWRDEATARLTDEVSVTID